jgi:hypothetical protein
VHQHRLEEWCLHADTARGEPRLVLEEWSETLAEGGEERREEGVRDGRRRGGGEIPQKKIDKVMDGSAQVSEKKRNTTE